MSRSIHRTRRHLEEAIRSDYADIQAREGQLEEIREQLGKKRRIKDQVTSERRREATPLPPTPLKTIPIQVRDEHEFVHYPTSPEDLRAVMRLLPAGVLDGLQSIVLCLGTEYQRDASGPISGEPDEADPLVGRPGCEWWPGVFSGRVLGIYDEDKARIYLCAYVYDPAMPDREIKELYLRLRVLATFVHEVAHHFDSTARVARGRWRSDCEPKDEFYARSVEHDWVQRSVVPYLESAYPQQAEALRAWIEHHGGVSLPLSFLAGDPRTSSKDGQYLIRPLWSASSALDRLVEGVTAGEDLIVTRLQFARELHYAEHYDPALEIIDRVLAEYPDDAEALTLQADIYEHQEQYDAAEAICRDVLSRDETDADAWQVLSDVYAVRRDWHGVLHAATRVIEEYQAQEARVSRTVIAKRARARLELGDFQGLESDLEELAQTYGRTGARTARSLRAVWLLRSGRYEDALSLAVSGLAEHPGHYWEHELVAVRFEAAHRLGRPGEAGELSPDVIRVLRHAGYEEWMDCLTADHGSTLNDP